MKSNSSPWVFILFGIVLNLPIQAQDNGPLFEKNFSKEICYDLSLRYLIYLPAGYNDSPEKWPLLLYLHGGMGRETISRNCIGIPCPK